MQWSKMFGGLNGIQQTSSTSDDTYQSQPPESYSAVNTDSLNALSNLPFYGLDTLVKSNGYNGEKLSTKSKKEKEQKDNMKSWKAICHILSHK